MYFIQDLDVTSYYFKSEVKKEMLRQEYRTTPLEKILYYIFRDIQTGGFLPNEGPAESMQYLTDILSRDLGVQLTEAQMERFSELYINLNNHSHLWQNCGWRPDDLWRSSGPRMPDTISIGPNLKKLFEEGKMDQAEFEQEFRKLGIKVSKE